MKGWARARAGGGAEPYSAVGGELFGQSPWRGGSEPRGHPGTGGNGKGSICEAGLRLARQKGGWETKAERLLLGEWDGDLEEQEIREAKGGCVGLGPL